MLSGVVSTHIDTLRSCRVDPSAQIRTLPGFDFSCLAVCGLVNGCISTGETVILTFFRIQESNKLEDHPASINGSTLPEGMGGGSVFNNNDIFNR